MPIIVTDALEEIAIMRSKALAPTIITAIVMASIAIFLMPRGQPAVAPGSAAPGPDKEGSRNIASVIRQFGLAGTTWDDEESGGCRRANGGLKFDIDQGSVK